MRMVSLQKGQKTSIFMNPIAVGSECPPKGPVSKAEEFEHHSHVTGVTAGDAALSVYTPATGPR